jgi:hypothetical protein
MKAYLIKLHDQLGIDLIRNGFTERYELTTTTFKHFLFNKLGNFKEGKGNTGEFITSLKVIAALDTELGLKVYDLKIFNELNYKEVLTAYENPTKSKEIG